MKLLDRRRFFVYKLWPDVTAALLAAAVVLSPGHATGADQVLGVPMPKRAVPEGPYRYASAASLRDVVKFFKKVFKNAPHRFVDALDHAQAKVIHIRSGISSTLWEGINLSLYHQRVHIFVIPRKGTVREARGETE